MTRHRSVAASASDSSRSISSAIAAAVRQRDVQLSIDAVFADDLDRSRIDVLDRRRCRCRCGSRARHVAIAAREFARRARWLVPRLAPARTRGTDHPAAARSEVTSAITPSVPSEPMKRSIEIHARLRRNSRPITSARRASATAAAASSRSPAAFRSRTRLCDDAAFCRASARARRRRRARR